MSVASKLYQTKQRSKRTSYNPKYKVFSDLIPISKNTYYRLYKKCNAKELYNILNSKKDIHDKKRYVYGLSMDEDSKDNIWEKYIEG